MLFLSITKRKKIDQNDLYQWSYVSTTVGQTSRITKKGIGIIDNFEVRFRGQAMTFSFQILHIVEIGLCFTLVCEKFTLSEKLRYRPN